MVEKNTPETDAPPTGIPALVAKVMKLKPVRVFMHYAAAGGPLMASGLAFQGLFAAFAGLWVGFSVIGLVIANDPALRSSLIDTIAAAVPGLIESSTSDGAIDPDDLLSAGILNWTGAIALVGLFFTAVGFLASARDAIRRIFSIAPSTTNFLLLKLKDLGLAVGFGAALIVSTVLSAVSTSLLGAVLDVTGIGSDSMVGTVLGRALGLIVVLLIDTLVLGALYRVLAGIPIPFRRLAFGALLGGIGLGVLKLAGNLLLGGRCTDLPQPGLPGDPDLRRLDRDRHGRRRHRRRPGRRGEGADRARAYRRAGETGGCGARAPRAGPPLPSQAARRR
jgi:membrane protein